MPYIKQIRRFIFELVETVSKKPIIVIEPPADAGELNYVITRLLNVYIHAKGKNYQNINEIIGVLECAKLELYRRIAAPYEDTKIAENGDVY